MSRSRSCELCDDEALTTRYVEDAEYWIADCLVCHVPMVVWRRHDPAPPPSVRERLIEAITPVARDFFATTAWYYDDHMRKIPDHYHGHARPA